MIRSSGEAISAHDLQSRRGSRVLVAALIGILAALWVRQRAITSPAFVSDFDQIWAATRALLEGRNPYLEVGPDARFSWKWPLYYPLPALLVATPLAALPVVLARMAFAGISAAVFSWAITRDGWSRWPILLSLTFVVSIDLVQWSPLLASAFFLPVVGGLAVSKPNFMVPLILATRRTPEMIGIAAIAALLVMVSFAVYPSWLESWMTNVQSAPHFRAPISRPFGFVLILAVLRWRRPEARWLLGLSLIPQAPSFYDQLLLVVVCLTWWETATLAAGTYALFFIVRAAGPQLDYATWGDLVGNTTVWCCYLPCLLMILRRSNEGAPAPWMTFLARQALRLRRVA